MKKYYLIAALCVSVFVLTACGDNKTENVATTAETTEDLAVADGDVSSLYTDKYVDLGEYKGIELEYKVAEPTEDEINSVINQELDSLATFEEVTNRPVQDGDTVNIDYVGTLDGVAFDGGTADGYDLEIGSGQFIDGFESGLIGANLGDIVELNLTFPEKYKEDLAGKDVVFTVTINSISEKKVPELSEDVVSQIGAGYSSVDEYRQSVKDSLVETKKSDAKADARNEVLLKVKEKSTIKETPEWLVDFMTESVRSNAISYASMYGVQLDEFVSQMLNETMEEFEAECKSYGIQNAEGMVVSFAIAKDAGIELSDEEMKAKLDEYKNSYGMTDEEFKSSGQENNLLMYIQNEKVVDYLFENAVLVDENGNKVNP